MAAFTDWFRTSGSRAGARSSGAFDKQLAKLEAEAEGAALGLQGLPLNRAGDLCHRAGDTARALRYYGRAIDAFLEDGQPEAARGVAKKIIRVHPDAVRTLCTLTWLDLASGLHASALEHLHAYAVAARRAGRHELAGPQIVEMARVSGDASFLEMAVTALETLELGPDARLVREWAAAGGSADAITDPAALAQHCFHEAVRSNAQRRADGAVA
ncbi:MAG: hypothetical protein D6701_08985 [Gemmatimonadetes bacterium]|nr:MAG: hypothetical protein D6701_08985 [Gemmatimonadota bacterium]